MTNERLKKALEICDEYDYKQTSRISMELKKLAFMLGYETLGHGIEFDNAQGALVQRKNTKYNNGVYLLKNMDDGSYFLQVLVENDIDKSDLIDTTVRNIVSHMETLDLSDLGIYDMMEIFSHVIDKSVTKPLSEIMFPNLLGRQLLFQEDFMIVFLAYMANYYKGNNVVEDAVNLQPIILKEDIEKRLKDDQVKSEE